MDQPEEGAAALPPPDANTVLQWAQFYAFTMGWVIQPIHKFMGYAPDGRKVCSCEYTGKRWNNCNPDKPGKHPWRGWKQAPMETPEQGYSTFKEVWDRYPDGVNIGVRTGKVSGIWALDIDMGGNKNGVIDLQNWAEGASVSLDEMNATLMAKTGGGGFHYVFRYPPEVDKIKTVAPHPDIGPSVDVKGDGGYILVAPSVHASGAQYLWMREPSPQALLDAPATLTDTVQRRSQSVIDIDMSYTPSLNELKDYADLLASKKKPSPKAAGKNMQAALRGEPVATDGGAHDVYRDIMFYIAKRWPRCDSSEIIEHFSDSLQARFSHKSDASTDIENIRDSMVTALDKANEESKQWTGRLLLNDNGKPVGAPGNIMLFLKHHPAWEDVLGYNVRTRNYSYLHAPPIGGVAREVDEDHDGMELAEWFQTKTEMVVDSRKALDALRSVANHLPFDPLYNDLLAIRGTWDGVPRLETIFQRVGGAEDTEWVRQVTPLWFKSLVARILWPGCKVDTMLILEGQQGRKKSSFFETLLPHPQWFDDSLTRVKHDTQTHRHIHSGPVIFEISELVGLKKQEVEDIKAFLSTRADTFDEKYRKAKKVPRRCVLVGSTNADTYLRDESGGRRFWPIKIDRIDPTIIEAERAQWIAEAAWRVEAGEPWWIDGGQLETLSHEEQDARYEEDIWEETVLRWLRQGLLPEAGGPASGTQQMAENANKSRAGEYVTVAQIAEHALGIEMKNARGPEAARIIKILRREGWFHTRIYENGKRVRVWKRPPQ